MNGATPLDHALYYASLGWRVFPVQGKQPLTPHGFIDATTDATILTEWWTRWPDAGIAKAIEATEVVVDTDTPEAEAWASATLPATLTVITAKGCHRWYTTDHPIARRVRVRAGLDILTNGYALLPPSKHPSGAVYAFKETPTGRPVLAPYPADIVAPEAPETVKEPAAAGGVIPDGQRNSTIAAEAGYLIARGYSIDEAVALLTRLDADRCRPPLGEAAVARVVESIARTDARNGNNPHLPQAPGRDRVVLPLSQLLTIEYPDIPMLVDRLVPRVGVGLIAGEYKAGKSLLAAQLGACIAGGHPFLGFPVTQTAPVLLVEEEGGPAEFQARLRTLTHGLGLPGDIPLHLAHRQRFMLDDPAAVRDLRRAIEDTGAGVVIIGPLAQVAAIDENDNGAMNSITRVLLDLSAEFDAFVALVHHTRKHDQKKGRPKGVREFFASVRGASALTGAVDLGIGLDRDPERTDGTVFVLRRDGEPSNLPVEFDRTTLLLSQGEAPRAVEDAASRVTDILRSLAADGSTEYYPRAVIERLAGWSKTKTNDALSEAVSRGLVQTQSGVRGALLYRAVASVDLSALGL